jgi:ISXO2 transposase-like protein
MSRNIFVPPPEARLVPRHPAQLTIETLLRVAPLGLRSGSISTGFILLSSDDAERFLKLHKRFGCCVPTMVLSEARGLVLFRVIRGGIGLTQRLGARHTDGWLGYEPLQARGYIHQVTFLRGRQKSPSELLPRVHRVISLLKRWLLGTHQGAIGHHHLDDYLDEFTFRFNRRTSASRGKLW